MKKGGDIVQVRCIDFMDDDDENNKYRRRRETESYASVPWYKWITPTRLLIIVCSVEIYLSIYIIPHYYSFLLPTYILSVCSREGGK